MDTAIAAQAIDRRTGCREDVAERVDERRVAGLSAVAPGMRALNVAYGSGFKETFWTGKRFAGLMETAIQLNRR